MIEEQINETLKRASEASAKDASLRKLAEFFHEMKRLGIAQNRPYDLPLVDTIGNTASRNSPNSQYSSVKNVNFPHAR